jgi:Histidine kinase-, DNA gyrase B-, and HSP90-like ATPase
MASDPPVHEIHDDLELVASIRKSRSSSDIVQTTLKTDERVIARVTDGIYRQPGSAIRELISNAFDADATRVVIKTDAPRFERISVEDDGDGMAPETLAHLLLHIGGSAKRNEAGPGLGITSPTDPMRSRNGRRLIGKIGIGLFSVSQLTHTFQIITKVQDDDHRTVATIALRQYADEDIPPSQDGQQHFESGKVNIWRERAADKESHGTTIILTSIRPQARDTLRSREIWSIIEQNESLPGHDERQTIDPPRFHIGRVDISGELLKKSAGRVWSLPWEKGDAPAEAFRKLVQCVWDEIDQTTPNPQLARIFDYYLRMVWQLSLAVPVPYFDGHLFDMGAEELAEAFLLSNGPKGSAETVKVPSGGSLRSLLALKDPIDPIGKFDIFFDDLKLSRPIKFRGLPPTNNALKAPLVFVGKCREEFSKLPRELSGGPLAFEAYLIWAPKIAPTEHQGSLIRIHGASGTLFDSTFMRYQVSELTRLRQISCEIFVSEGLDSALNIDRESFNNAHPHSVYITKWLHSALRQLATAQKRLASEVRELVRDESTGAATSNIKRIASEVWTQESEDPGGRPPDIELTTTGKRSATSAEAYVFARDSVVSTHSSGPHRKGASSREHS